MVPGREPTIPSLVDRLPNPFADNRRIFVQSEQRRPLEALWPGDDHPHSAWKRIGSNPSLILLFDVPASGLVSRFNPLAACGRDSLAVENDQVYLDIVPRVIMTRSGHQYPQYRSTFYLFGGTSNDGIGPWGLFLNHWMEGLLATVIEPQTS
jgi:hypothetical protein